MVGVLAVALACSGPESAPPGLSDTSVDTAWVPDAPESVGGLSPLFSHARGFYDAPFELDIWSSQDGAEVRVSLDGRSAVNGEPWSGPLTVDVTTTVSAVVLLDDVPVTDAVTHSFFFLDQVAEQAAPASWPTTWWGGYAADYGLDPELSSEGLVEALQAVPTVSLVLASGDLWGPSGIYENPTGEGVDWEVPVSLEWLSEDDGSWQLNAGLRIMGGASRDPASSPKKALRLLFKADYGPTSLDALTLPEQSVDTFDTLILRARYNQSWIHWDSLQRSRAQYVRDQFARSTQHAVGQPSVSGRYVQLYLNGLYWGFYNIHPRPQASFLARVYGGEDADYDAVNSGEAIDGEVSAWTALQLLVDKDITTDEALAEVSERVELDNLIDYMLVNFYLGNDDWPSHNWYAGRHRSGGVGWVFFAWDSEHTLKDLGADVTGADYAGSPARIFQALRAHPDFVAQVQQRAHVLFADGGPLSAEACLERYEGLAAVVRPAVMSESLRWGDYRRDVHSYSNGPYELYTAQDFWDVEHERLTTEYLPQRSETVVEQLILAGLY